MNMKIYDFLNHEILLYVYNGNFVFNNYINVYLFQTLQVIKFVEKTVEKKL